MRSPVVVAVAVMLLAGCGSTPGNVRPVESLPAPASSDAMASALADAGIPPEPDGEAWELFIAALVAIDPDIVHGKEEKAVDRARNQCSSVKQHPKDQARLVKLTDQRFSSPDHPDGFGTAKAAKILVAVRKYICPTY